jgi:1-acyl-sn-glycerol-3-phosphate acyltransferase
MKRVPPKPVRRLVIAPLVVFAELFVLALSPFLLVAAAFAAPLYGGTRPLRATVIVLAGAYRHLEALLTLLLLWLRGERSAEQHYEVMHRFVAGLYRVIVRFANVEVVTDESPGAYAALRPSDRPVVLLGRHAGEGDTLLVIHELVVRHRRRPHIVMHHALRVEPLVDVLGSVLPNRFIDPRGGDIEHEIAALAQEVDGRGALVLFPEGTNFSEAKRRTAIERLEQGGHHRAADLARRMGHVSAPRPGGALAAIDAVGDADVVFMGHVGFPDGPAEVWRELPRRQTIDVKLWHEPAEAIPADPQARVEWLFDRWKVLDAWVAERTALREHLRSGD